MNTFTGAILRFTFTRQSYCMAWSLLTTHYNFGFRSGKLKYPQSIKLIHCTLIPLHCIEKNNTNSRNINTYLSQWIEQQSRVWMIFLPYKLNICGFLVSSSIANINRHTNMAYYTAHFTLQYQKVICLNWNIL